MLKRADWFFAYTETDRRIVVDAGFPDARVTTVGNTIDTATLMSDLRRVLPEDRVRFREEHGLQVGHTALFIGALDSRKYSR